MKYVLIFCVLIFAVGCSDKSQLSKEILFLRESPVALPERSEVIFNILEGMRNDSVSADLKYVVYKDSIGCTSCAINKMYLWNSFIEYAKNYNNRLKYYFIYSPSKKDYQAVHALLLNGNFNYPILLDTLGEFEKLNPHLPKNKALHTFLLDENNNVILVGSPLHNKKIEEMFYRIVEEKLGKPE